MFPTKLRNIFHHTVSMVWWKILRSFVENIHLLFNSERILKIGYDWRKLLPKVWWLPFLGHSVYI